MKLSINSSVARAVERKPKNYSQCREDIHSFIYINNNNLESLLEMRWTENIDLKAIIKLITIVLQSLSLSLTHSIYDKLLFESFPLFQIYLAWFLLLFFKQLVQAARNDRLKKSTTKESSSRCNYRIKFGRVSEEVLRFLHRDISFWCCWCSNQQQRVKTTKRKFAIVNKASSFFHPLCAVKNTLKRHQYDFWQINYF